MPSTPKASDGRGIELAQARPVAQWTVLPTAVGEHPITCQKIRMSRRCDPRDRLPDHHLAGPHGCSVGRRIAHPAPQWRTPTWRRPLPESTAQDPRLGPTRAPIPGVRVAQFFSKGHSHTSRLYRSRLFRSGPKAPNRHATTTIGILPQAQAPLFDKENLNFYKISLNCEDGSRSKPLTARLGANYGRSLLQPSSLQDKGLEVSSFASPAKRFCGKTDAPNLTVLPLAEPKVPKKGFGRQSEHLLKKTRRHGR